jgi:methylenetetrahydrofolate dehydrogenase (NADP+)/methenyltetrahydrofolate cyclohydrolase
MSRRPGRSPYSRIFPNSSAMSTSSAIIDGAAIAAKVLTECRADIEELRQAGRTPGLAVVLVGDDPASRAYVRSKDRMCRELGLHSVKLELPAATTQAELLAVVRQLNEDPAVHGILVQSPPPRHIDERAITLAIDPAKDIDGFHPMNVGKLAIGDPTGFVPCTPLGCQRLLLASGIETAGAHVVVLGRSLLVGKPFALLMMQKGPGGDATVTVAHSRSRGLSDLCRQADILVVAIGRAGFVRADAVREGAVVIDVGINQIPDPAAKRGYRLVGDVDYAGVAPRCRAITPVPGGVGPMTIAMLMANTIKSCRNALE